MVWLTLDKKLPCGVEVAVEVGVEASSTFFQVEKLVMFTLNCELG